MSDAPDLCPGCVYWPPNLPRGAYAPEDWRILQRLPCAFELDPGGDACRETRKTSCAVVRLDGG